MSLSSYALNRLSIEVNVVADDTVGGRTTTWTPLGSVRGHVATIGAEQQAMYRREGLDLTKRVQCENLLPKRISGYTTLYDALTAETLERLRFVLNGMQLVPKRMNLSCDGKVGPDVLNVDCMESIRPTGYQNV